MVIANTLLCNKVYFYFLKGFLSTLLVPYAYAITAVKETKTPIMKICHTGAIWPFHRISTCKLLLVGSAVLFTGILFVSVEFIGPSGEKTVKFIPKYNVPLRPDSLQKDSVESHVKPHESNRHLTGSVEKLKEKDNGHLDNDKEWGKSGKSCKKRLPHCIIIGSAKCGTKALIEFMGVDPHLSVVRYPDEIHFFDFHYDKGLEWYRKQMTCSEKNQLSIEKTPQYWVKPDIPEKVLKMNSSIKMIIIVKEPVQRTISGYLQSKAMGRACAYHTFEEMVLRDDGSVKTSFVYTSLFHIHFKLWLRYFKMEQFHVVDGDNFVEKPAEELQNIEKFLGVEPYISEKDFFYNKTKGFYCIRSREDYNDVRCLRQAKGRKHPDVDPQILKKLKEFYKPHNEEFFKLVGRRFNW